MEGTRGREARNYMTKNCCSRKLIGWDIGEIPGQQGKRVDNIILILIIMHIIDR